MSVEDIRDTFRPLYDKLIGSRRAARDKARIRDELMRLPITPRYPFDVEAKLLRSIGLARSPVLDVGANKGLYSTVLEDVVGPENLYLFEPLPELCCKLRRRFRHAHVFDFALSSATGRRRIRVPYIHGRRFDSRASLNGHVEVGQTGYDDIDIAHFPLDAVAKTLDLRAIGLIKIDVEGHELDVLDGGRETIARFRPLMLVEIEARHHRFPITQVFARLLDFGYRGYYVDPGSFAVLGIDCFDSARDQNPKDLEDGNHLRYLNNFLFAHESVASDFVARSARFLEAERRAARAG